MSIDALEWPTQADPEQRNTTTYMYGVDSLQDGPCAQDYDPHVHAERLGVPVVVNNTIPDPEMVACYSARRGAIFVRPNLPAAVERCAVAHEIVHFEHRDVGCDKHQEDRANRVAASRLLRPSRLYQAAEGTDDYGRMALELGVTEHVMRLYLQARGL